MTLGALCQSGSVCHIQFRASILSYQSKASSFWPGEFSTPAEGTLLSMWQLRDARSWSLCSWCVLSPSILGVLMEEALKRSRAGRCSCQGWQARWLGLSLKVHWWISSWPILLCSVHLDGIFPQSEKLKKLVFGPLLQGHESSCFLLQVLIDGKNDLGPLLCLLVSRVPEEPLQGLLVYVFKDVAHSFLARGRVKVVAVDGRAYSERRGHAGGLVASLCFHRCGSSPSSAWALPGSLCKTVPGLLFKVWTKLRTQITLVTSRWSQGGKTTES